MAKKQTKNRIRELRQQKHLTLQELGDKLGLANNTLSQYETGKREPKLETWQKLADFFNVAVPYLQGFSKIKNYDELNDLSKIYEFAKKNKLDTFEESANFYKTENLNHFKNLYNLIEADDFQHSLGSKKLYDIATNINDYSILDEINMYIAMAFEVAIMAKGADKKAQKAYNQTSNIFREYFGYNGE